ncbi:hypothetical protein Pint_07461 [Pistacia integerrima]|uniref:Uncharacterized protein n=2 Tax=Pistacia TaxID=55512 RepID=A0ACC1ALM0_9ROSI|nr:hypothetical protein Pint_07461 [Pistacia integerrima]KAJ0087538.1 hypothetical protein Patl1_07569 [Pistacia atlantica]
MEGIRLKDLPTLFRSIDMNDIVVNICMVGMENAFNASTIISMRFWKHFLYFSGYLQHWSTSASSESSAR